MPDPERIFPDEYVPNAEGVPYHKSWAKQNPGEASKWAAYRDAAKAHKKGQVSPGVPVMATKYGKALVAAAELHVSVTDIGAEYQPPPQPPPIDPPPPSGTLIWNGDLDTGNETQFTNIIRNAADRWRVTAAADGRTPRQGGYMSRVEVKATENSTWASNLSATLAIKQLAGLVGYNEPYTDVYMGWSAYIPSTYFWNSNIMHNIFIEIHGNGSMIQAPFHWGVFAGTTSDAGKLFLDLHRDPSAYAPVTQPKFELLSAVADSWIDCVVRIKWSMAGDGILQYWQDGVLRHTYNGPTAPITGESIKGQFGMYAEKTADRVIYLDEMKIGTTREIVAPG